jgi:hypothetical protein
MQKPIKHIIANLLKCLSFFLCIFITQFSIGQTYIISSMGSFNNTSSNANALNFKSITNCIDVQSGLAIYNSKLNTSDFSIDCKINQQFNTLGLLLFPNPMRTFTKVKFNIVPPLQDNFTLTIWNPEGYQMYAQEVKGFQIYQGLILNLNKLSAGNYILKIESLRFIEAIKFIKLN